MAPHLVINLVLSHHFSLEDVLALTFSWCKSPWGYEEIHEDLYFFAVILMKRLQGDDYLKQSNISVGS